MTSIATEDVPTPASAAQPPSSVRTTVEPSARNVRTALEIDQREMADRVREILGRRPAVGLAVGVVRNGALEFFYGHGLANIPSKTPVTEDTVFRICSITKTFTAIAIMQLWEQRLLDLDAPANDYLRAFKLVPTRASFRPATIRHLLTHTAGIPEQAHPLRGLLPFDGEYVRLGRPLPTLAEYYGGGLLQVAEPGTRFVYGNQSFAALGQIVEDVSGEPLDRYFREHIFAPLGMADTDLVRSERLKSRLATGYSLGPHGPKKVTDGETVTAAAGGIYSTSRDMARYLAALLGGGTNDHGAMLKPATLATMFAAHYQPDPRVTGMGLAFVRTDLGGHLAIGHKGILPGFNGQILVAPDDGVGVMAFTNGARDAVSWLPVEIAGLLRQQLGVPEDVIRTDIPQRPDLWGDLCGWYGLSARLIDLELRSVIGAGFEVFVRHGELTLRGLSPIPAMYQGFPLHPDDSTDPDVFRIDMSRFGMGTSRVVFRRDAGGAVKGLHLDMSPVTLNKRSAAGNPRRWVGGALGALAIAGAAGVARRHSARARRETIGVR